MKALKYLRLRGFRFLKTDDMQESPSEEQIGRYDLCHLDLTLKRESRVGFGC